MNEPGGWTPREDFAREMLRTAATHGETVPLTMGCKSLSNNRAYDDPPLDVLQFHCNLPETADAMAETLTEASAFAETEARPIWLTEWQRTREEPPDVLLPHYASLAGTVRDSGIDGDFFWSLMVKPAYLPKARELGRVNGVYHEDGCVWSTTDARAIAEDDASAFEERRTVPDWVPEAVTPDR